MWENRDVGLSYQNWFQNSLPDSSVQNWILIGETMAVHSKMGLALTLPKLGPASGKKFVAYKVTGSLVALSLGTAALAVVAGGLLFM